MFFGYAQLIISLDLLEVVMQDSLVLSHLSPFHYLSLWVYFAFALPG